MQVYCTRPLDRGESPHVTELPDLPDDSIALNQWQQQFQSHSCEKCGMPLILSDGRYIPIDLLGYGGFGSVFLAYDLKFPQRDRTYARRAIKQFRSDRGVFPGQIRQALKAFESEVAVLDQLHHAQIPRVYEPFQVQLIDRSYAYFVQEYVPGENLQSNLSNTLWNEASVWEMLRQLLEILDYLQTRSPPVIHRDIKPSNIIQTKDGKYHLIDFGSVRQVIANTVSTLAGQDTQIVYTPGYAPSEQLQGQVGFTTDLYALAKTCICLLTGKPDGNLSKTVTPQFKGLLLQMIDPDPVKRPASASAVLKQLDRTLAPRRSLRYALLASCAIVPLFAYSVQHFGRPQIPQRNWSASPSTISAVSSPPPLRTYFYGGSTTAEPLAAAINVLIPQSNPALILQRKPPEQGFEHTEEGIDRLIQGELDFALSSKNIQEQQAQNARDRQIKLAIIAVATTTKAVIVHPELPIANITSTQLALIQARKILNWKAVGGPDLPIRMYATDGKYLKNPKGGEPQAGVDFVKVHDAEEAFQRIQRDRGGFYVAPTPVVVQSIAGCPLKALKLGSAPGKMIHPYQQARILSAKQCQAEVRNQVNLEAIENLSYPLKSTISVIVLQDGDIKQWIGEYYAYVLKTAEARTVMQQLGYVQLTTVKPEVQSLVRARLDFVPRSLR
ncbi:protein kinase [Pseudanabaenaceae cyanobacterium LEGE 13415]|nr:protein kinase [Pseudanabaenaceae cyanobacterium LEGE 13415]